MQTNHALEHKTDTLKTEDSPEAAAPTPGGHVFVKFPEDQIKGDGFTQLDPNTGWLWVGINLNKFSFRSAWAFFKSQEFQVSQYLDQREQAAMLRAQIAAGGSKAGPGLAGLKAKLGLKG